MSKQSIMDRVTAAKHSIAGQGLAKVVCKATTEEVMGPKKKHLDYLLQCTNEPNVSIPQLADLLIERTQHANWVVVYKSLITIHNLMNYGNERFTQYLASNNCSFNLGSFIDKGGVQGYDMSTFIRRYSKYLNEKAVSYRQMAFDFCKVRRGKEDGLLRTMNADKLLKTLPALQRQIDSLLEFDCSPNELSNGVINACFLLMFKDLIRLFACYNDGIINLLEKYFDMNKKQCKEALDIYKRFLVRMDKVSEFLKTAESVGIEKSDIPDLAKAPSSLLDALEQHYQALEGKKGTVTPVSGAKPSGFAAAINTISSNTPEIQVSEEEKKRILDEENARLQQLKSHEWWEQDQHATSPTDSTNQEQRLKEIGSQSNATPAMQNNPFMTGPQQTNANSTSGDLFGSPNKSQEPLRPSDDLLSLTGNPFVQNVQNVMAMNSVTQAMNSQNSFGAPAWNNANPNVPASSGGFTSDVDFEKVFHNSQPSATGSLTDTGSTTGMFQSPSTPQTSVSTTQDESLDSLDPFLGGGSTVTTDTSMAMGGIFSVDNPIGSDTSPTMGGSTMSGTMPVGGTGGTTAFMPNPVLASPSLRASPAQGRSSPSSLSEGSGFDAFGEVLQPNTGTNAVNNKTDDKLIHKDLDTSLVQLAGNLNIKGTAQQVKKQQHEWQPKGEQKKTGGQNWQGQPTVSSTTWTPPYNQPMVNSQPMMTGQPMMGSPAMTYNSPGMMQQPGMMGVRPMGMQMGMQQPAVGMPMGGMGMQPAMYGGMQPMGGVMQQPRPPTGTTSQTNDPFGAL